MTRQRKTPAQRASEALDIEQRRVAKIGRKVAQLRADLAAAETEGQAAKRRLAYLEQNPDLPSADPANVKVAGRKGPVT